jgi:phosphate-selective porin OprO and OprP
MSFKRILLALLGSTLLAAPALAEQGEEQPAGDPAARIAQLEAQMAAMQKQVEELKEQTTAAAPSWRGTPQFTGSSGWSFKPRGRLQFDAGYLGGPKGFEDPALGFANRLRRGRLGAEGTMPGGFGYRIEADFAGGDVEVTDAYVSYRASPKLNLILGQHNNFQALDRITSSNFTSFMERAAFTSAFGFERRVGISASYASGALLAQGGVFTDDIAALTDAARGTGLGDENSSIGASGRVVVMPKLGSTQLHFGGSAHFRNLDNFADAQAITRYRARPFLRTHNLRFLATPNLRVEGETHYGLEAAAIRGPFHVAGEVHWLNADSRILGVSPTFFGGYAEVGFFLTGETRGYRAGAFDRTKVLKPVGSGGMGALQLNLRYDRLDLTSGSIVGGSQDGFLVSLIWIPQDHVRFLLNYGHLRYNDAAIPIVGGDRNYSINVLGARAQIDF